MIGIIVVSETLGGLDGERFVVLLPVAGKHDVVQRKSPLPDSQFESVEGGRGIHLLAPEKASIPSHDS